VSKKLSVVDCLCHNTRRASRLLTQYYDEVLRPSGVGISQFTTMVTISEMGQTTYAPLADFLGVDRTTLSRNLELMARDGLVWMEAGLIDRRQQVVRLTEKGVERLAAAMPLWEKAQREALKRLKKGELPGLLKQLSELSKVN